jgi:SAM-dependent methyltransferase
LHVISNEIAMTVSGTSYGRQWDQFYTTMRAGRGEKPLWDVAPDEAVARDYNFFSHYFDRRLPIVDFGCGTGAQTAYLAQYFSPAVGIDVAASAVAQARREHQGNGLQFEVISEGNADFFPAMHLRLGDANVYMRGVLHQILDQDLPQILDAIRTLMGRSGRLFLIEVADNIRDYLNSGPDGFSQLPPLMRRTLISRLPPRGVSLAQLSALFPEQEVELIDSSEGSLATNIRFRDEKPICIPAVLGIFGSKKTSR